MTSEWEQDVLPLEQGTLPPATQEEISLDGSVTDAYLVPVGAETVSVLAENADTQVQVMGNVELFTENPPDPDPEAPLIDADGYDLATLFDKEGAP